MIKVFLLPSLSYPIPNSLDEPSLLKKNKGLYWYVPMINITTNNSVTFAVITLLFLYIFLFCKNKMNTFTNSVFKNLYGETLLTSLFFSEQNTSNIQILIKRAIFKELNGIVIDDQSLEELLVVMRSVFLSESNHPPLIDKETPQQELRKLYTLYTKEVARLNSLVVNQAVPIILSYVKQYLIYESEIRNPIQIMEKPMATSIKGEKNLEMSLRINT